MYFSCMFFSKGAHLPESWEAFSLSHSVSLPSLSLSNTGSNCIVNFRPAVSLVAGLHTKPPRHFNVPYILQFNFHSKTMISTRCALLVLSCLYSVLTFCSSLILFRWAESSRLFSHMLPLTSLIFSITLIHIALNTQNKDSTLSDQQLACARVWYSSWRLDREFHFDIFFFLSSSWLG